MKDSRFIKIPNWCIIGKVVLVKYPDGRTGDKDQFYAEEIIAYTNNGFFTQADGCPMYEHKFTEYGKTVKDKSK